MNFLLALILGAYPTRDYASFDLVSPNVDIVKWDASCEDGKLVALAPWGRSVETPGPMLLTPDGELVWMEAKYGLVDDLKVQHFQGRDYLTFWSGANDGTHGRGEYYMLDSSYEVVKKVKPVGDLPGDLHDFHITPEGTALMTIYDEAKLTNMSGSGWSQPGWIIDSLFQEIDLETGELLFQWRATDHYAIEESYAPIGSQGLTRQHPFDFFHINSIDKDSEGNYIISSRYMCTITCVSPSGSILWILGGRRNMFTDLSSGAATNFTWQHHASWNTTDSTLTIFDNGAYNWHPTAAEYSRGLHIALDLDNVTATLVQQYIIPDILSHSQGSVQRLDSGNVFVGWGHSAGYTEFAADGEVLCDIHYGDFDMFEFGWVKSYRVFKHKWIGRPKTKPAIAVAKDKDDYAVLVSWNGATEITTWSLRGAKAGSEDWTEVTSVPKDGFETYIGSEAGTLPDKIRAVALDINAVELGVTEVYFRPASMKISWHTLLLVVTGPSVVYTVVLLRKRKRVRPASWNDP